MNDAPPLQRSQAADPRDLAIKRLKREVRKQRRALVSLTADVAKALAALDDVMRGPSTPERGKQVASLSNELEMANDMVRRFALGETAKVSKPRTLKSVPSLSPTQDRRASLKESLPESNNKSETP